LSVDLHTHTTHSDGTFSPGDLVRLAKSSGLSAIAITDHDVTTANSEALAVAAALDLQVVPGIELSVDHPLLTSGHLDILGLFIDYQQAALNRTLDFLRSERRKRNEKILDRLRDIGVDLSLDEVRKAAGEGSIGRPHIARVLMDQNHVASIDEAFQRYLKTGAPAFVEKVKLVAADAIGLIHAAGGLAIIAHPFSLGFSTYRELGREILALKKMGLQGIEAHYPTYSQDMSRWLCRFASENDLLVSGGSDFHGKNKPQVQLGSGFGNLDVPDNVYADLRDAWKKI
jgi:predicted metal-dependent phosphoesterase TrpH